jgi:hypothetical protein
MTKGRGLAAALPTLLWLLAVGFAVGVLIAVG